MALNDLQRHNDSRRALLCAAVDEILVFRGKLGQDFITII